MNKLLLLLALFAPLAFSDDLTVDVIDPVTWSNGDQITAGQIVQRSIIVECGGVVTSALTDQMSHEFLAVPDGVCNVTASVVGNDGQSGSADVITMPTGNTMDPPGINVLVSTGFDLAAFQAACSALPNCTLVVNP